MMDKEYNGILIYAQVTKEDYLHTVFFELVDKAKELAQKLGGVEVNAVIFSKVGLVKNFEESFKNKGLNKVYYFEDERLSTYSNEYYSALLVDLVDLIKPEILLIGATNEGRDLAPRVASALHTGLTADCTGLDINEKGQLAATRPTFGGQLMATILCKTFPQMATVRPNVFKTNPDSNFVDTEFVSCPANINYIEKKVELVKFEKTVENIINELDNAEIIVAGGKGLKNENGVRLLKDFAQGINGTFAATRGLVEMGLAPASVQIGQTGKTVHPRVYIACAISGAIQHTVGMENSDYIIAINNDENAPIFEIADTGIVGDVFEILPKLVERFNKTI
ncbi:MAG: electron transfer flavoprotein subunit alpha/FixB family protein [Cyanobacteria bacterium SIG26]|nr:electron transfer flavoprotein subunit alpha/FixB family protein [Cyanobacteria bacterium SIG26]